jgi:hypothetical protein
MDQWWGGWRSEVCAKVELRLLAANVIVLISKTIIRFKEHTDFVAQEGEYSFLDQPS